MNVGVLKQRKAKIKTTEAVEVVVIEVETDMKYQSG